MNKLIQESRDEVSAKQADTTLTLRKGELVLFTRYVTLDADGKPVAARAVSVNKQALSKLLADAGVDEAKLKAMLATEGSKPFPANRLRKRTK